MLIGKPRGSGWAPDGNSALPLSSHRIKHERKKLAEFVIMEDRLEYLVLRTSAVKGESLDQRIFTHWGKQPTEDRMVSPFERIQKHARSLPHATANAHVLWSMKV